MGSPGAFKVLCGDGYRQFEFASSAGAPGFVEVRLACASQPEAVAVTNGTTGVLLVREITSLKDPRPGLEPFLRSDQVQPARLIAYYSGQGSFPGPVGLSTQTIFDDMASDEGVRVVTDRGTFEVLCAQQVKSFLFGAGAFVSPSPGPRSTTPVLSLPRTGSGQQTAPRHSALALGDVVAAGLGLLLFSRAQDRAS